MLSMIKYILLIFCILGFSYWLFFSSDTEQSASARKARYFQAMVKAEPLIDAIQKYTNYHKSAPQGLADLAPGFIAKIPDTGLKGCDRFKYVNYGTSRIVVLWYDLGSRYGRPLAKKSQYPDGGFWLQGL